MKHAVIRGCIKLSKVLPQTYDCIGTERELIEELKVAIRYC